MAAGWTDCGCGGRCLTVSFGLCADISLHQLLLMFGRWIPVIFRAVSITHSGASLSWAMHHGSFPWGCLYYAAIKVDSKCFFIPGQWWAMLLIDQHSDPTVVNFKLCEDWMAGSGYVILSRSFGSESILMRVKPGEDVVLEIDLVAFVVTTSSTHLLTCDASEDVYSSRLMLSSWAAASLNISQSVHYSNP